MLNFSEIINQRKKVLFFQNIFYKGKKVLKDEKQISRNANGFVKKI